MEYFEELLNVVDDKEAVVVAGDGRRLLVMGRRMTGQFQGRRWKRH